MQNAQYYNKSANRNQLCKLKKKTQLAQPLPNIDPNGELTFGGWRS